jgi:hypothetical protein
MSSLHTSTVPPALGADDVARLVGKLAGRRLIESVIYIDQFDVIALQSGHFAVLIERNFVEELKNLPPHEMKDLRLSASGTTIELENSDVHIEAAGLLADFLNHLRVTRTGGPMLELLQGRTAAS